MTTEETKGGPPGTKKPTEVSDVKAVKSELAKAIDGAPKKKKKKKAKADDVAIATTDTPSGQWLAGQLEANAAKPKPRLTKEDERRVAKQRAIAASDAAADALRSDAAAAKTVQATKRHTANALQQSVNTFIDGPVAAVCNAFVALFLSSRNPAGDSAEAVAALDACREAFDACGLILADVDTQPSPKASVATTQPQPKVKSKKGG